jgi:hypothetical protein
MIEIDMTVETPQPIVFLFEAATPVFEFKFAEQVVISKGGFNNEYTHILSQVDVDNKFISMTELSAVIDKSKVLIFLDNIGLKLAYNVDYSINSLNKIIWSSYTLDGVLAPGDVIKVFY